MGRQTTGRLGGAGFVLVVFWSLPLALAQVNSYETKDGLLVSQLKRVTELTPPGERPATASTAVDVSVELASGRRVILEQVPALASLYRLQDSGALALQEAQEAVEALNYLKTLPVLAYDRRAQTALFLTPEVEGFQGLALTIRAASQDLWTCQDSDAAPQAVSLTLVQILRQLAPPPEPAPTPKTPSSLTSGRLSLSKQEEREKIRFFRKAKNHPSYTADIKALTTPRSASPTVKPQLERGMWYAGVLQRVGPKSLVVTTWAGDVPLKIRTEGTDAQRPTRFFIAESPSNQEPVEKPGLDQLQKLEPGQFITIYASAKTKEVEWVTAFQGPDQ